MGHYIGRLDWSFTERPLPTSDTSSGLARLVIVGPEQGAVHTELAIGALAPGGWLRRHVHAFEEALYVLAGELVIDIAGVVHRLVRGD
ncbi:MAG TPA: cupin domain-containing protein, partial [Candidatus Limnocylindrales bacterium]|nr:cupin domain-containing protein [Candidatus Limnocylindrales bacterium]